MQAQYSRQVRLAVDCLRKIIMTISFHELPDPNAAVSGSACDHSQAAMDKYWAATFKCCRGFVVAVLLLVCSATVPAALALAQSVSVSEFLNIDCGATGTHVDPITNFTWVPDTAYIDSAAGKTFVHEYPMLDFPETASLRYFDDLRPKNCYTLPVTAGSTYLLRVTYFYFNYDAAAEQPPWFEMAIDATVQHVNNTADEMIFGEYQYVAQSNVTYLCLIRTSPLSTPFISSISLKPATVLSGGHNVKFRDFLEQGNIMKTIARVNYGGTTLIRAPDDFYDRFWFPEGPNITSYLKPKASPYKFLATAAPIPIVAAPTVFPPTAVLQTAVASNDTIETFLLPRGWNPSNKQATWYVSTYFAELINASGTPTPRNFIIEALGDVASASTDGAFLQSYFADLWPSNVKAGQNSTLTMSAVVDLSSAGPILNCMEVFAILGSQAPKTVDRDALAIEDIKRDLNLKEWTGDPCLPVPHLWISCSTPDITTPQPHIIAVNLSGYQLQGRIPASFANLLELTTLRLENNSLNGPLPKWLTNLAYLSILSVQNNNFEGPIPQALLLANSHIHFTYQPGNPLLTGVEDSQPLGLAPMCDNCDNKPKVVGIVGASIGGVLALISVIAIAALLYCQCWGWRKAPHLLDNKGTGKMTIATLGGARAYSLAEVEVATTQFTWLLGKQEFGDVYYGKLPNGQEVAVKVANGSSKQGEREFFNEVDVLSRVHHKNLVALVGYCQEQKPILIYEYMQNGSLFDHLHGTSPNVGKHMLDWRMRLHIALNAAQGLEYLHTGCSSSLIHRDVKSSNILLTPKFDAKVADFGLTKFIEELEVTRVMTDVMGTIGYLDPEYYETHYLSSKSDVYSFGIVLLELITGRLPIDHAAIVTDANFNIAHWVRESLQNNNIDSVLDSAVKASNPNMEVVWEVAEIAMRSVEPRSVHRTSMADVVQALQRAVATEGISMESPAFQTQLHSKYSNTSYNSQHRFTSFPMPV